jgi:hypothetical protein
MIKGHRKKIPRKIKELKGTLQPCRDDKGMELPVSLNSLPPAPRELKGNGLIYYTEQGNKLFNLGLINEYNLATFITICFLISKVDFFQKKLDGAKSTSDISMYARLYLQFQQSMRISSSEFGLTPASAKNLFIPKQEKKSDFESFMGNGK